MSSCDEDSDYFDHYIDPGVQLQRDRERRAAAGEAATPEAGGARDPAP